MQEHLGKAILIPRTPKFVLACSGPSQATSEINGLGDVDVCLSP